VQFADGILLLLTDLVDLVAHTVVALLPTEYLLVSPASAVQQTGKEN
jgi:hypothetical protein